MIIELSKAAQDQEVMCAAQRAGMKLVELGLCRFVPVSWDKPMIAYMDDGKCIAGINYENDADLMTSNIRFAFCDDAYPKALAKCLIIYRKRAIAAGMREINFTYHAGNPAMQKAGKLLGVELFSKTYRRMLPEKKS
jgi:hypothetical protein